MTKQLEFSNTTMTWFLPTSGEGEDNQPIGENPCPFKESPHCDFTPSEVYLLEVRPHVPFDFDKKGNDRFNENRWPG